MIKKLFILLCIVFRFAVAAPALTQDVVKTLIPKLNSDRITYFFGNYGVDPIPLNKSPFGECRVSNLYSLHQGQKIMRTLAVVQFNQPVHPSLKEVHQEILQGQSIGISLRKNGWKLDKIPLYFGSISLSSQVRSWMQETGRDRAALHIYKLTAIKGERIEYCTILEVHSPQYLDGAWLEALYPEEYPNFQEMSQEIEKKLEELKTLIEQFPTLVI